MAKAFARQGATLALIARRENKLQEVQKEIEALGAKCIYVPTSITDTEEVKAAAAKIESELGKVDILLNCAGAGGTIPIEDTTDDDWEKDISVDLTGQFKMIREFGKIMIKNHYGRIINIASMYGLVGNTALPSGAYHAAKGAMVNFTRAVAAEWAK
jgi:gluconate 5-dehydrogenase